MKKNMEQEPSSKIQPREILIVNPVGDRRSTMHKKKRLVKKSKVSKNNLSQYTQETLLQKAREEIDTFHYEKAQEFCKEALARDNDNLEALEMSASLCLEMNNVEGAKHCLGRAISLSPNDGYAKYFSMAQIMDGKEALQCNLKGIEILSSLIKCSLKENLHSKKQENEEGLSKVISTESISDSLIRKLSNAFCSVAELYMSDLCDEEEAESESYSNIQKAISADPNNPESYQCYANFLLVKQDVEEARNCMKKSVAMWLPKYLDMDDGMASASSLDPMEICPLSQAARVDCARLLIELKEHSTASEVLEGLLGENDELSKKMTFHDLEVIDHIKDLLNELKVIEEPAQDDEEDSQDDEEDDIDVT